MALPLKLMKTRTLINSIRRRRLTRNRAGLRAVSNRPRLSIFRSHSHIYVQIIDDSSGRTLAAASSFEIKNKSAKNNKTAVADSVGKLIAERGVAAGVTKVIFDRGRYHYHGRIRALAESARTNGLEF